MVRCDRASIVITFISLFLAPPAVSQILGLPEGASCETQDGLSGKCVPFNETTCPPQFKRFKENMRKFQPVHCSFRGMQPIICCEDNASAGTGTPKGTTNSPVPKDNAPTTGRKALRACQEMERQVNASFVTYILNGNQTGRSEFPHMVALGYRQESDRSQIDWACGGSLISTNFVLTAAHCIHSTTRNKPDVVRVGAHNLSRSDEGRQLRILQDFVHPDYLPPAYYNDVALLKIPNVKFDENTAPACLWTSMDVPDHLIITGWGAVEEVPVAMSEVLLQASLVPFTRESCSSSFSGTSFRGKLSQGLAPHMICARGAHSMADTCGGDSGGPLQASKTGNIQYNIVGVTSFGHVPCGRFGVYTRVASFLRWIESNVWPN